MFFKKFKTSQICFLFAAFFVPFLSCSNFTEKHEKNDEIQLVTEFMTSRTAGKTDISYKMLDDKTKQIFSKKQFENYCFVFRVIEFEILPKNGDYIPVSYTFYDKKHKKNSNELYTFYITKNIEQIKIQNGKIVFPYIGFIALRKEIEQKNIEKAKYFSDVMLSIDPQNPDILESAEKMGFLSGKNQ